METIGDAYCVAGGLHRRSRYHAQQIAWMALKMMHTTHDHAAHDGKPIQVIWFADAAAINMPVVE